MPIVDPPTTEESGRGIDKGGCGIIGGCSGGGKSEARRGTLGVARTQPVRALVPSAVRAAAAAITSQEAESGDGAVTLEPEASVEVST